MGLQGVGGAIRDERLNQNLTQAQLASKARVSREWLSGVERGERSGAELSKILQVFSALDLEVRVASRSPEESTHPDSTGANSSAAFPGQAPPMLTTNEATRLALKKMMERTDSAASRELIERASTSNSRFPSPSAGKANEQ